MSLPTREAIENIFSQDPASFTFRHSDPGKPPRSVGGREGAAIQIDGPPDAPTSISLAVVLPNNDQTMARRGGILLMLLLTMIDRDWGTGDGGSWLTQQLDRAARDPRPIRSVRRSHNGRLYRIVTNRSKSTATLTIGATDESPDLESLQPGINRTA